MGGDPVSGVQQGRRLDRLRELERAVRVQIELEEIAEARGRARHDPCAAYPATDPGPATDIDPRSPDRTTLVRVPVQHVAPPVMRAWGRANRYEVRDRGPLDDFVVGAFIEAHQ